MRKRLEVLLPLHTKRRKVVGKLYRLTAGWLVRRGAKPVSYDKWMRQCEPALWGQDAKKYAYRPLISIVVPTFNTPTAYWQPLLASVLSQTYDNWQLCVADASTDAACSAAIQQSCKIDRRISYVRLTKNYGISRNTNHALKLVNGEFVALLDHDDTLSEHALAEVVRVLNIDRKTDIMYSDEDKLSDDGKRRLLPFFKPDWSPEMLLGINYITHFLVIRTTLLKQVGGLRPKFDGAQDYDLLLRATEKSNRIVHIPKILYHWRLARGSTAKRVSEKDYATIAGRLALEEALKRRGIKAEAREIIDRPTNYRPVYTLPDKQPKVSIIIPFKDKIEYLRQCVSSISEKSTYQNYEILLIANNCTESATTNYLKELQRNPICRILEWNHPYNFAAINNYGSTKAKGSYLVFLNNDTKILTPNWIEELIGVASQPNIGAVGPMLFYPNNLIQHAGVVLGMGGMAGHVFRFRHQDEWTDFGLTSWPRNVLAVTGACLAVKARNFDLVGGFDERLRIGGNDVALCISLYEKGLRNVFWPFAALMHYENISVGSYDENVPIEDYNRSLHYYRPYLKNGDPYFNPNLDIMNEQVGLRSKP